MNRWLLIALICACLELGCAASFGPGRALRHDNPRTLDGKFLPARVRRLSNAEYEASVNQLASVSLDIASHLPPDARQGGYTRNAGQVASAESLSLIDDVTRQVAHAAAHERLLSVAPCAAVPNRACLEKTVETLGTRAFRRPLTAEERGLLLAAFASGAAGGAGFAGGLELVLRELFVSPSFMYNVTCARASTLAS